MDSETERLFIKYLSLINFHLGMIAVMLLIGILILVWR